MGRDRSNPYRRKAGEAMDAWLMRVDPEAIETSARLGSVVLWLATLDPERQDAVRAELERQLGVVSIDTGSVDRIEQRHPAVMRSIIGGKPGAS